MSCDLCTYDLLIFCIKLSLYSQMLSEAIMHECVFRLLRSHSDVESLECFARLITTTGKDLDHPQAKVRGEEEGRVTGDRVAGDGGRRSAGEEGVRKEERD